MIYLELLGSFLKIGLFAFGGAYGALPLIRDVVQANQWMDDAMLTNLVAVSEATPGPIMVNMATYIGSQQGGLLGAVLATVGVVLPSFVIVLLVTVLFGGLIRRPKVQAVLKGVKPCLMGVILATGVAMAAQLCLWREGAFQPDWPMLAVLALLAALMVLYRRFAHRELSPILLILAAAVCGVLFL